MLPEQPLSRSKCRASDSENEYVEKVPRLFQLLPVLLPSSLEKAQLKLHVKDQVISQLVCPELCLLPFLVIFLTNSPYLLSVACLPLRTVSPLPCAAQVTVRYPIYH